MKGIFKHVTIVFTSNLISGKAMNAIDFEVLRLYI